MIGQKKGQTVGYVRVKPTDQNKAREIEAIGEIDRLFVEKFPSNGVDNRMQLKEMLAYVRERDVVRVKSSDRLSRSTTDLLSIVEELESKGVAVEFVDSRAQNTDTRQGESMLTTFVAIAQLETSTIRERRAKGNDNS